MADDRKAVDKLVEQIKGVQGEVYLPAFPAYAVAAGKSWWGHYSPLCDIAQFDLSIRESLREAVRAKKFAAIIPRPNVEPQDVGLCDIPDLEKYYEPAEAVIMPKRPSAVDILLGRPSTAGIVHGGKFSYMYRPKL
jgi:hypothetical protein